MSELTTKGRLIQKGAELVYLKGFNNTGIQEVLKATGIPRGSFYFYFKSKEEFGLSLIEYYSDIVTGIAEKQMISGGGNPVEGLRKFFNMYSGMMKRQKFTCGCPIGNIAQEMSDLSASFRNRIAAFYEHAMSMIRTCIVEAQKTGRVGTDNDPDELSEFIFNSWEGALIDMKVTRSSRPLEVFMNTVFGVLLK